MKFAEVKVTELIPYPDNPRVSNVEILAESLEVNGQYRPVVVQSSTKFVLAGNHLVEAAKTLGWEKIAVVYVDADDEQAKKIVVADNRLADLGTYDEAVLAELLDGIDLSGTGFTEADLDDLLATIEEQVPMSELRMGLEEAHNENVKLRPTLEERAQRYAEKTIRLLMAEYNNDVYIWIQDRLKEMIESKGLGSNADAILMAIEIATGKECDVK